MSWGSVRVNDIIVYRYLNDTDATYEVDEIVVAFIDDIDDENIYFRELISYPNDITNNVYNIPFDVLNAVYGDKHGVEKYELLKILTAIDYHEIQSEFAEFFI